MRQDRFVGCSAANAIWLSVGSNGWVIALKASTSIWRLKMRKPHMLIAVALATMVGGVSLAQGGEGGVEKTTAQAQKESCPDVGQGISYYRSTTWKWQRLMGTPKTKASRQEATVSCRYAHWVAKLWQKRSLKARRLYERWVDFRTI